MLERNKEYFLLHVKVCSIEKRTFEKFQYKFSIAALVKGLIVSA